MSEGKRERQRRKHAAKQKARARAEAERERIDARRIRSYDLADDADEHLGRGRFADALRLAARAADLNPGDWSIARLYLAAAEGAKDTREEARALDLVSKHTEPDPRLLGHLAYLYFRLDDFERSLDAARRARAALPARMKGRKELAASLDYLLAAAALRIEQRPAMSKSVRQGAGGGRAARSSRAAAPVPGSAATRAGTVAPAQSHKLPSPPRTSPAALSAPPAARPESWFEIPVEIADDVDGLEVLGSSAFVRPEEAGLAILASRLRDAESYQRLFSIDRARGLLRLSHQEDTARKVLSVFLGRALLADEVGLGKTVEAGLVLSEYLLRGRVDRALVLTPATLVGQWREELASKFGIEARTTEEPAVRSDPGRFWSDRGVVIASLPTARNPRHLDVVTANPWDLVIVDEAHALKNAASASYALVSRLTSRFLLLLTATPVENKIEELYNLVSLLRPGHLGGRAAFLGRFSDKRVRASESARAEVRALLGEVMVRNTRALSGVDLPPRFAHTVLVSPEPAEGILYGHLADALRALGTGGRTRMLLSVLLQEAGSSPFAARATLEKVAGDADLAAGVAEALAPAIACAGLPATTGKAAALLRVLAGAEESAVVFTRFRPTLDYLADVLTRAGIRYELIDGRVPGPLRHEAIARMQAHGGGVLLSTDVGAEGLNLQFCRRIVNFDLPWNPMRIEQRIGRVHRIGQDHAVDVVNFCLAGSIEERILEILDERINLFELVVGEAEMILGYLEDEREFPDLVLDAFADREAEERERSFTRIADALAAARTRYDNVKRFDEGFFRNELGA